MKDPNFSIVFSVGKFNIYWYAVLLALGIAVAMLMTDRRAKKRQLPKDIALDLCILGVPCGVLGARLFACLSGMVAWSDFVDLTKPGLSFFGGAILAAAAMLVYLRLKKADVGEMADAAAPAVFTGIGIAVWGDFFNRSNYGPLVTKASLKWFPLATFGDDLKVHYAAFFYEFLLCVLLIVLYYAQFRKAVARKEKRFLLMALLYCVGRFCIDGIRQGLVKVGPLAFDQVCEIVLIVLCLCLLLLLKQQPTQAAEPTAEPEAAQEPAPAEAAQPAPVDDPEAAPVDDPESAPAPEAQPASDGDFSGLD